MATLSPTLITDFVDSGITALGYVSAACISVYLAVTVSKKIIRYFAKASGEPNSGRYSDGTNTYSNETEMMMSYGVSREDAEAYIAGRN